MTRYIFMDEISSEVYCSVDYMENALEVECSTKACVTCIECKYVKKVSKSKS